MKVRILAGIFGMEAGWFHPMSEWTATKGG